MKQQIKGLYIVLIGAPASGKGTQALILTRKYHIAHLSTGDMLREFAKQDTPLGRELSAALARGEFATDAMIVEMVKQRIKADDCRNGFILDGFPRTLTQAEILLQMFADLNLPEPKVIELKASEDIIVKRVLGRYSCAKCGAGYHDTLMRPKIDGVCDFCGSTEFTRRTDDNAETVKKRLEKYQTLTYPIVDFFVARGLLYSLNGADSPQVVNRKIVEILNNANSVLHKAG